MAGRFRGFLEHLLGSRHSQAVADPATDADLLRRYATTNDQDAFELLVWRHGQMILGVCHRLLRDQHLAEDAFQAVFLVLGRKAGTVRSGNLAGWLFRVARRVAARVVQGRVGYFELPEIGVEQKVSSIERAEDAGVIDAEIARLPHRLRQPILLCYLGGRSTEEAARELGCPRGTVLSRLSAARKTLTYRLSRRGMALPAVLPIVLELDGRTASATVAAALRFMGTNAGVDSASLLAQGVIRTMSKTKQLTILSAVVLAASLIAGVGWVSARSGSGEQARDMSDDVSQPGRARQLAKKEGAMPPMMNDGPVHLDQKDLHPEDPEQIPEILKLDPVIARALKPDTNDSPIRKLQKEACLEWGTYLAKIEMLKEFGGKWGPEDFPEMNRVAMAFPKSLLELMDKPEDKLKCYELEVRLLENLYNMIDRRVKIGSDPPQSRNVARALWLEAKVKLLKFKMEMDKRKG